EDPDRIDAGLTHALRRSADLGDVYVPAEELVRAAEDLLQVDTVVVERGLESAVDSGRVRREADRVYGISLHRSECDSAELLADMLGETSDPLPFDEGRLRRLQRDRGVTLSPGQIEALRLAHDRHVLVLTGGPGTGKTTLTRFLLDLFEELGLRLGLAAPTGRAARRLAEATGREASTLHRLLAFDPQTSEFSRDASDPLDFDVLLVDEASMVDQWLFANLLRALPLTARLVLVGDADQLPSVGPGEVLRDLIKSGVVPTARLDRIFRQGERSGIVENAHRILAGDWPEAAEFGQGDFVFLERDRPEDVAQTIREYVSRHLPATGLDPRRDIQVLVPMYKGEAGADALNRALQSDLNAKGREARLGARKFREGDRVIQLRNDYTRNVFNGEIGHVEQVREEGRTLAVRFDSMVELGGSEWDQLALAYAITVHKSQGSEYDWVVFPLTTQHAILLERPLFYTAVTRARKGVLLVGSRRALALALRTGRSRERRTTLAARLRGDLAL
ncbi:MAG: AAA family ATPase, partial [Gemmatimonadetes bacterium]|nr:AAA family ATPase [Gemmatimonadota bacterium]